FESIGIILLQKDLKFNVNFFYNTIGYVSQLIATIIAAVYFRNYWALVVGAFIGRIVSLILSYALSSYRPKFDFSLIGAKHLFKYGKWIGITGVILFFVSQGDYLTIGKVLNA